MNGIRQNLLLADDDADDCDFFREALDELQMPASLTIVNDGVQLMEYLFSHADRLPDVLFLDLNMPRKTGQECLCEIKSHEKLKSLQVIIFSTSIDMVDVLYEKGASYYIRKPSDFSSLKKVISDAIQAIKKNALRPSRENFVLGSKSIVHTWSRE